jgi:hypothetical protein
MLGVPETMRIRILSRTTLREKLTWLLEARLSPNCSGMEIERFFCPISSGEGEDTVVSPGDGIGRRTFLAVTSFVPSFKRDRHEAWYP